jgi:hypothetical protein
MAACWRGLFHRRGGPASGVGSRNRQIEEWTSGWYSLEPYVAFSVDNQRLFSGTAAVGLAWDRQSKKQTGQINGYASDLSDLTVSPDGQQTAQTAV